MANGVLGVVPTVTWPSHTTLITGVGPAVHGIRGNRRPAAEGGDYPWSAKLLKARTLLDAAHDAGLKTATVTWPVTVDAPVDFNLPEYFQRRRGGAMDLPSIESKSTPADLVKRITGMFPSFPQEWMDDRTRTQAVVYLLKMEKPDLILVHLVDLDSEQHENGPFSAPAKAILEYTDELLGQMLAAMPSGYAVALVSDHGFERVQTVVNLKALAAREQISGVNVVAGIATGDTPAAGAFLRAKAREAKYGFGREISKEELQRFAPEYATVEAAFDSAEGFMFGSGQSSSDITVNPKEMGSHGHWPMRYRAVYVLRAKGVKPAALPELPMETIAGRLASVLGLKFSPGARSF